MPLTLSTSEKPLVTENLKLQIKNLDFSISEYQKEVNERERRIKELKEAANIFRSRIDEKCRLRNALDVLLQEVQRQDD